GNAVGETGDHAADAIVNAADELGARANQRNFEDPAPIDFAYDFDRDGRVDATDQLIARQNQTNFLTALKLIGAPAALSRSIATRGAVAGKGGVDARGDAPKQTPRATRDLRPAARRRQPLRRQPPGAGRAGAAFDR